MKKKLDKIKKESLNIVTKKAKEETFLKEGHFLYMAASVCVSAVVVFLYTLTHLKTDQIARPIKYNYLFGIIETGTWSASLLLPALLVLTVIINAFFANYFHKKDRFLTYVFILINLVFCIIVLLEEIALNAKGSL